MLPQRWGGNRGGGGLAELSEVLTPGGPQWGIDEPHAAFSALLLGIAEWSCIPPCPAAANFIFDVAGDSVGLLVPLLLKELYGGSSVAGSELHVWDALTLAEHGMAYLHGEAALLCAVHHAACEAVAEGFDNAPWLPALVLRTRRAVAQACGRGQIPDRGEEVVQGLLGWERPARVAADVAWYGWDRQSGLLRRDLVLARAAMQRGRLGK